MKRAKTKLAPLLLLRWSWSSCLSWQVGSVQRVKGGPPFLFFVTDLTHQFTGQVLICLCRNLNLKSGNLFS